MAWQARQSKSGSAVQWIFHCVCQVSSEKDAAFGGNTKRQIGDGIEICITSDCDIQIRTFEIKRPIDA